MRSPHRSRLSRLRSLFLLPLLGFAALALLQAPARAADPEPTAKEKAEAERLAALAKWLPAGSVATGAPVIADGVFTSTRNYDGFAIDPLSGPVRLSFEASIPKNSWAALSFGMADAAASPFAAPGAGRLRLQVDRDGFRMNVYPYFWNAEREKPGWDLDRPNTASFTAWTTIAGWQKRIEEDGIAAPTAPPLAERWVPVVIEIGGNTLRTWINNQMVSTTELGTEPLDRKTLLFNLGKDAAVRNLVIGAPATGFQRWESFDLRHLTGDGDVTAAQTVVTAPDGTPFTVPAAGALDLSQATWVDEARDPSRYTEAYDAGPYFFGDRRMPFVSIPTGDFTMAHLLVQPAATAEHNVMTLRIGRYGYNGRTFQYDVPITLPPPDGAGFEKVDTPAGPMYLVHVPLQLPLAWEATDRVDVEITKAVALARRSPDPNRFRLRPIGPASHVKVAAITFERSPVTMRPVQLVPGNVFAAGTAPVIGLEVRNLTDQAQSISVSATVSEPGLTSSGTGVKLPPGASQQLRLPVPFPKVGYKDVQIELTENSSKRVLLTYATSVVNLPPGEIKHPETNRLGTWDFSGGHDTSRDADLVGQLHQAVGIRYGMFGFPSETRAKYGVIQGREPGIHTADKKTGEPSGLATFEKFLEGSPDNTNSALIFHESAISGPHVMRVPDLFTDRAPYVLNESERKRFDDMVTNVIANIKAIKAKYPDTHFRIGNGTLPMKEELYREGFPGELFDSAGNESGSFGRLPEAQPPDYVANNASIWMDRKLLDHYGFTDKPVTQCFEITYPNTNPGNLTEQTQADYFVRHFLHAFAWDIPEIRMGTISDMGNSYQFSNWGSSGFFRRMPGLTPKPAVAAIATMVRQLDGATYVGELDLKSDSLYGLHFTIPNGRHLYALWTVRGMRPVDFTLPGGAAAWTLRSGEGREVPLVDGRGGSVRVELSPSPIWLSGTAEALVASVGEPVYKDTDYTTRLLATFDSMDNWSVETGKDLELETHNFMSPRRLGDFDFSITKDASLRIEPKPITVGKDTQPMYAVLKAKTPVVLQSPDPARTPTTINATIVGNSGWGRLIYELRDAKGERWISIGASQKGDVSTWMLDWMPAEVQAAPPSDLTMADWNTEDVFGISRINFDGTRQVKFPLPGNYPGGYYWPANSQWKHSEEGVVDYPLSLTRVIVELPEKVLHLKDFRAPRIPHIELKSLSFSDDPRDVPQP